MRSVAKAFRDREAARASYWRDPVTSREKSRAKVALVRAVRLPLVNAIKLERGCIDCGYGDRPEALQFDHRDPATKRFQIAKGLTYALAVLLAEIEKCDVRCANCHVIRSVREGHLGRPRKDVPSLNERMVTAGQAVTYAG